MTGQAETGQADARRAGLVTAAQEGWAAALTDLGGRNTLLYYKDRPGRDARPRGRCPRGA